VEDTYKTVARVATGTYKEKGSRFIASAYPVTTAEEIKQTLLDIKTKYPDARHHCHAWTLGIDTPRVHASDDGEPSSTAGRPILGQIHARDLSNVLVIVVRYFGGTKLGVPGLTRAYRAAAAAALDNAGTTQKTVVETARFTFHYRDMNDVMKILKEENIEIIDRTFDTTCSVTLQPRRRDASRLRERLSRVETARETAPLPPSPLAGQT
jgi:uncharacterized YigZ family protein